MTVPIVVNDGNVSVYGFYVEAHGHVSNTGGQTITARNFGYNTANPSVNAAGVTTSGNISGAASFTGPPATADFFLTLDAQAPPSLAGGVCLGNAFYGHRARAINASGTAVASDTTDNYWQTYYGDPSCTTNLAAATGYTKGGVFMTPVTYGDYIGYVQNNVVAGVVWSDIATNNEPQNAPRTLVSMGTQTEGVSVPVDLTSLPNNTTIYVRGIVINTNGLASAYGTKLNFNTPAYTAPVVGATTLGTLKSTGVTSLSAQASDTNSYTDNQTITAQGWVIATHSTPTTSDTIIAADSITGYTTFNKSAGVNNLSPRTTYFIRGYSTNPTGTTYGAETSFTTPPRQQGPTVKRAVQRGSSW